MKFDKEMSMGEILSANPKARAVLEGFGMHCCGCPMSQAEVLGDACEVHDIDVALVLEELNNLPESEEDECGCGCCCHDNVEFDGGGFGPEDYDDNEDYDFDDDDCCCGDDCDCDDDCDCGCQDDK